MFWNSDFLNPSPSHIDQLFQTDRTIKLCDILFEDDLLQEIKTSNINLANFLIKPENIAELVENITQLTEKDCCDKLLYSRVHAAYISCEILTAGSSEITQALMDHPESLNKIMCCLSGTEPPEDTMTKVVPQKATLVSKLISTIHSAAPANISCYITKNVESFSKLITLLVHNIDISGSFEILSTFIHRTLPPELRYVFCEILSKLNFIYSLIDVMTLSDSEDKQRNACQLLCDIIVIGRQEASEQTDSGPMAQDMLAELLESKQAVHRILKQMFSEELKINTTAIVCGMKVLQTLIEQKTSDIQANLLSKTIEQIQDEIVEYLVKFHELLLNPPTQEPIKTTFGIIQKPLGYIRLEVVNLIRALISTNSLNIIKKLVELKTMKTIIDLFVDYSWNNLLHTQVEQALCLVIKNCRHDEELEYETGMEQQRTEILPSRALLSQILIECDLLGKLLLPNRNNEQANFGHIIQIMNSILINGDLDAIKDHLNDLELNRTELYNRWKTFVTDDVASFKEVSLYFDVQKANNNVNDRFGGHKQLNQISNNQHFLTSSNESQTNSDNVINTNGNGDNQLMAYFSFTKETVIPSINVDVLPKSRRLKNAY